MIGIHSVIPITTLTQLFLPMKFYRRLYSQIPTIIILTFSIVFGVLLRLQNLPLLEGKYLLGPDSYRHFRHIRQIVEEGGLPKLDTMRHAPLGRDNTVLSTFFPWMFAQIFKGVHRLFPKLTLNEAAIFYPVVTSVLIFLLFFLLVRRLFSTTMALFSVLILATLPAFISRTIAGYADYDPATMLFYLFGLYFAVEAWQPGPLRRQTLFTFLSGIAMGILSLIWPGTGALLLILAGIHLIRFWMNEWTKRDVLLSFVWSTPILFSIFFLTRVYTANITAPYAVLALGAPGLLLVVATAFFILQTKSNMIRILTWKGKLSFGWSVSMWGFLLMMLSSSLLLGPKWLKGMIEHVFYPFGKNPVMKYVGELHQPYWIDWWHWYGFFFFLMVAGVGWLDKKLWKHPISRRLSPISLFFLIVGIILSRLSPKFLHDGNSTLWNIVLLGSGGLFLLGILIAGTLESFYRTSGQYSSKAEINKAHLLVWCWFILGFILTRSGQRFNLILAPAAAIAGSFCLVKLYELLLPQKGTKLQLFFLFLTILAWQSLACQSDILTMLITTLSFSQLAPVFSVRMQVILTLFITALFLGPNIQVYLAQRRTKMWVLRSIGGLAVLLLLTFTPFAGLYGFGFTQKTYVISHILAPFPERERRQAVEWLRENTPQEAVIAAWWELGSVINELGRRSTVIDEEQFFPWIHLMAKHIYCAKTEKEALEFLKAHSATHLLLSKREVYWLKSISEVAKDDVSEPRFSLAHIELQEQLPHEWRFAVPYPPDVTAELLLKKISPKGTLRLTQVIIPLEWQAGRPVVKHPPQATLTCGKEQQVVSIRELFIGEKSWYFPQGELKGCLWIDGFITNWADSLEFIINSATYLPQATRESLLVKLFLGEHSKSFKLVYQPEVHKPGELDVKIWEIHYPEDIKVRAEYLYPR